MRKIALGLALILAAAALRPQVSLAEECVTVYGGGVICGASTEHVPVDTAINNASAVDKIGRAHV